VFSSVLRFPVCSKFSRAGPDDGANFGRITVRMCGGRVFIPEGVDVGGISVGCEVSCHGLVSFRECP
jgi:hypothetical protein